MSNNRRFIVIITDTPFTASEVEFRLTKRSGYDFTYSRYAGLSSSGGVIGNQIEMTVGVWHSVNTSSVAFAYFFDAYDGESLRSYTLEIRHKASGLITQYYIDIIGE